MTQPHLRIRGAARARLSDSMDEDADISSNESLPPLEPVSLEPALPIRGRAPSMTPRRFTIYRQQGTTLATSPAISTTSPATSTTAIAGDTTPERTPEPRGRRSRTSHWSSDESDNETTPPASGPPLTPYALPWNREETGDVTRLEQYLVITADGERLFFRMTIRVERTAEGFRPDVAVDFLNYVPSAEERAAQTTIWLLFAQQMESTMMRAVDRGFMRVAAAGLSSM